MSRSIIVTQYVSLDGVIEDPVGMEGSGLGDWTGPFNRGPEGDKFKHEELMNCDALLFGRKTYDGFAAVWPTVNDEAGFAKRMNSLPKYLASTTIDKPEWNNTTLLTGNLLDAARALKDQPGGDILIYGSAAVVHTLLPHGLIDEFRLMVYPTVLGRGIRLFPDDAAATLSLAECRQFNDGIVLLRYETSNN
ncbi:dihydrofolate reductase family protein [Nitratireductor soli]|uniref:dihydrofolate reductase family protein n=1 Tax=Nitratireductor soli TaxID=1670619 RepID=UPI00065E4430|nr:dihydrofolate reductase family protein [Nitratireductor soli]